MSFHLFNHESQQHEGTGKELGRFRTEVIVGAAARSRETEFPSQLWDDCSPTAGLLGSWTGPVSIGFQAVRAAVLPCF